MPRHAPGGRRRYRHTHNHCRRGDRERNYRAQRRFDRHSHCSTSRCILVVFRNRRVHSIPWLRIRGKNVELRTKPTRVIQAAGVDSDDPRRALPIFPACQSRAALGAKPAPVVTEFGARRKMVARRATRDLECVCRHKHDEIAYAAACTLAIPTVTAEHRHGLGRAFVADCAAGASSSNGYVHKCFRVECGRSICCCPISRASSA